MDPIEVTTTDELMSALKSAEGGEHIIAQGAFGRVQIGQINPAAPVTIDGGKGAHFERVELYGSGNLRFANCSFWPLRPITEINTLKDGSQAKALPYLFQADPTSSDIEVVGCVFRGRKDSDNHAAWQLADWQSAYIGAVITHCPRAVVRNNSAIGVSFGYTVRGPSSELFANRIFGFAADGLRVGGDNSVVIGNRLSDAVKINQNHPDGLQVFKQKGLLTGLVVKDNVILEWTITPSNPLRAKLQGIGLHNGPYADVVIRDNRVSSSSYNGIRTHNVVNVSVTGNQVRHADGPGRNFPAIRIDNCSGRVVVQNNLAERVIPPNIGSPNGRPDYRTRW